jgi:hypothetical protein
MVNVLENGPWMTEVGMIMTVLLILKWQTATAIATVWQVNFCYYYLIKQL